MFAWRSEQSVFNTYYGQLMQTFSVLNVILYVISGAVALKYLFEKVPEVSPAPKSNEEGDAAL